MRNEVIAGDYKGSLIVDTGKAAKLMQGIFKGIILDKSNLLTYEVINEDTMKSLSSGVIRGLAGSFVGPIGALAGVMSAKSKSHYIIAVQFFDGQKSLLQVDGKIYDKIVKGMY